MLVAGLSLHSADAVSQASQSSSTRASSCGCLGLLPAWGLGFNKEHSKETSPIQKLIKNPLHLASDVNLRGDHTRASHREWLIGGIKVMVYYGEMLDPFEYHNKRQWISEEEVFFWLRHTACGMLVSWPGIKTGPLAVNAPSPNRWNAREFPWGGGFQMWENNAMRTHCNILKRELPWVKNNGISANMKSGTWTWHFPFNRLNSWCSNWSQQTVIYIGSELSNPVFF